MSNNRSLISMNWQEASNGVWYAETTHYRCVAVEKAAESLYTSSPECTWDAIVYKWFDTENSWIQVEKGIMGSRGMHDAQLTAERLLGNVIERGERKLDPGHALFDKLDRVLQNAQINQMEQQRMQEDPRMRGLPPGHPPIRRRGDRPSLELFDLPAPTFATFDGPIPPNPPSANIKQMEESLKKFLDNGFPDRNKSK